MLDKKITVTPLHRDDLLKYIKFVVNQNEAHHGNYNFPLNNIELLHTIFKEEMSLFNYSNYFVALDGNKQIIGGIRTTEYNSSLTLPMERLFGFSPLRGTTNCKIWHIGKFAVKKELRSITIFKELISYAIKPIVVEEDDSLVFAECDAKLLRTLDRMGISAEIIGQSIQHLGSETVPVKFHCHALRKYYVNKNETSTVRSMYRSA